MNYNAEPNEAQPLTTLEAAAKMTKLRRELEAAGHDPLQCEGYLEIRALVADLAGNDVDRWKEQHLGSRRIAAYAAAEADQGRE